MFLPCLIKNAVVHIEMFNMNFWPLPPNPPLVAAEESLCASFLGRFWGQELGSKNLPFVYGEKKPIKKNHTKEFGGQCAPDAFQGHIRDVPWTPGLGWPFPPSAFASVFHRCFFSAKGFSLGVAA